MSCPEGPADELQGIWRGNRGDQESEYISMTMNLVREKQRSFRNLVRGQNLAEYLVALAFGPLTALAAWKANGALFQVGYGLIAATLVVGSILVWLNGRRTDASRAVDASVRRYLEELVAAHERRIRFLKGAKYWYAIPLFFGGFLVLRPAVGRVVPSPWDVLLLVAVLAAAWLGVWHMNDVRRVAELKQMNDDAQRLLGQIDRE